MRRLTQKCWFGHPCKGYIFFEWRSEWGTFACIWPLHIICHRDVLKSLKFGVSRETEGRYPFVSYNPEHIDRIQNGIKESTHLLLFVQHNKEKYHDKMNVVEAVEEIAAFSCTLAWRLFKTLALCRARLGPSDWFEIWDNLFGLIHLQPPLLAVFVQLSAQTTDIEYP